MQVKQDDCKPNADTLAPESHDKFLCLRSVAFLTLKRQSNTSGHSLIALEDKVRMVGFLIFFFLLAIILFLHGRAKGQEGRQVGV